MQGFAANYTVSSNADTNTAGTLRNALNQSLTVSTDATDTITFNSSLGTITLTSHLPILSNYNGANYGAKTITITGNGNTIDGASSFQAFFVGALDGTGVVTANIDGLTLQNCKCQGGSSASNISFCTGGGGMGAGAGVFVDSTAVVNLTNITFSSCNATGGASGNAFNNGRGGLGGGGYCGGNGGGGDSGLQAGTGGGGFRASGGNRTNHGGGTGGGGGFIGASSTVPNGGNVDASASGGGGGGGVLTAGQLGNASGGGLGGNGIASTGGGAGGATGSAGSPGSAGTVGGGGGGGGLGTNGTSGGLGGNGGAGSSFGGGGGGAGSSNTGSGSTRPTGGSAIRFGGGGGGGYGNDANASINSSGNGGAGGDFGGGGGGGSESLNGKTSGTGGAGGFGGGGGSGPGGGSLGAGGNGGFGGGAGAGSPKGSPGMEGGQAKDLSSTAAPGGAGAGLGGAIFVRNGGVLHIGSGCSFSSNTVTAGTQGSGGTGTVTGPSAKGGDIYAMLSSSGLFFDANVTLTAAASGSTGGGIGLPPTSSGSTSENFVKQGIGNLTLTTASQYTGSTTITQGTLTVSADNQMGTGTAISIGASGTLSSAGTFTTSRTIALASGSTINVANAQSFTVSGAISGVGGSLTKTGAGTLTLSSGSNGYDGATTISAGTLALSGSGTIASSSSVAVAGTLDISAVTTGATVQNLSGAGTITITGKILTVSESTTTTLSGPINGTGGSLIKTGAGTLVLSSTTSNYSGGTTISVGTIQINGSGNLGSGSITFNGGSLQCAANGSYSNSVLLSSAGPITVDAGITLTLSGQISGTGGALTKSGAGTLALSNTNSYNQGTTFAAGILQVSADANLGSGGLTFNGGELNTTASFSSTKTVAMTGTGTVNVANSTTLTLSGVVSGTGGGLTKSGAGTLVLSNTNTYNQGTTFAAGILQVSADANLGSGGLTFNGGELNTTASFSSTKTVAMTGAGTVNVTTGVLTLSGAISGTGGALTKLGTGTLVLSNTSSNYSQGTIITAGLIQVSGSNNLGTGTITFNGGNLQSTANATLTNAALMSSAGSITVDPSTTLTLSGAITGSGGALTKTGTGILLLSGNLNTFSSGMTISAGTVAMTGDTSTFASNVTNNAALIFNQSADSAFSTNITGSGTVTKSGAGTLTVSGTNSYSGGTTISGGTLKGNTTSLQGVIAVTSNIIEFNQTSNGTFSGSLTSDASAGTFNKTGSAKLTITSDCSSFTGDTNILAGGLVVDSPGNIGGTVTISSGARLQGDGGEVGNVINNGTLGPGDGDLMSPMPDGANDIGTFYILGEYTQSADALYEIEINSLGQSDLTLVTGIAHLDGYVHALAEPGVYADQMEFLILQADGGLDGVFTGIQEDNPQDFYLDYRGNQVYIIVGQPFIINSFGSLLNGNAKRTYDYLFCNAPQDTDTNLTHLQNLLLALPTLQSLTYALEQLNPAQYGATTLVSFQNNVKMAGLCFSQAKSGICSCCQNDQKAQFWIEPIGYYYNQKGVQQQFGFHNFSVGMASGFVCPISETLFFNPAVGFINANTNWNNQRGRVNTNTVYFSPSLTYADGKYFASAIIQGDVDFNTAKRNIDFTGLNTTCSAHFKSYNILAGFELGAKLELNDVQSAFELKDHHNMHRHKKPVKNLKKKTSEGVNFYVQPQVQFYYLNLFQENFIEGGDNYVNLKVWHKRTTYLQPNLGVKFIQEINTINYCVSPIIYLGYLSNIPLGPTGYVSTFTNLTIPCPENHFTVYPYNRVVNQLSMSAELVITRCKDFQFSIGYNLDVLSHMDVQMIHLKFNWSF